MALTATTTTKLRGVGQRLFQQQRQLLARSVSSEPPRILITGTASSPLTFAFAASPISYAARWFNDHRSSASVAQVQE